MLDCSFWISIIPQTLLYWQETLRPKAITVQLGTELLNKLSEYHRIPQYHFLPIIINTGSPQGCFVSPLLCTLLTYDCSSLSTHILKLTDDAAIDRSTGWRWNIWCRANNLRINVNKTKEMEKDFVRVVISSPAPSEIYGADVKLIPSFKYIGIHLTPT